MSQTSVPQTHPPGAGWCNWMHQPPYGIPTVEAWRRSWQRVEVISPDHMHPAMNVAGLWWRPVTGPVHEPEVRTALRR